MRLRRSQAAQHSAAEWVWTRVRPRYSQMPASGVSARSLHAGFRRFRDATPMGYLKNYRLAMARKALKAGGQGGVSVTNVALACGFTHLSKFARDYHERYGERPSDTLRAM